MTDGPMASQRVLITEVDVATIRRRLIELKELLARGASSGGADGPPEVLIASKYFDPAAIPALAGAGVTRFGENRAEALEAKQAALGANVDARWDYIGELQSRKAADLAGRVDRIHTLASTSSARKLRAHAEAGHRVPDLLVQVNVAEEGGKGGVLPRDLPALLDDAAGLPVRGLMTMPPLAERPQDSRPWFAALRDLAGEHGLTELSMGTSQDAVIAAEEGATVVRVGGLLTSDEAWHALVAAHG